MSGHDRTQDELLELRVEAEKELARYPGFFGVGLGLKERSGEVTDEVAFRIYVREKKELAQLRPDDVLPAEFAGVPTDVLKLRRLVPNKCADHQQHSPLVGGISISTMKRDATGGIGSGTLGFHATINGGTPHENIVVVTNHHVIADNGGHVGDTIYQPEWVELPDGSFTVLAGKGNVIGTVLALPEERDYPHDSTDFYVDAASVKLDFCISSLCNTNCGISFSPRINGLALPRGGGDATLTDAIADVGTAAIGDIVHKVGRSTGRTVGRVIDITQPAEGPNGTDVHNNIEVEVTGMATPDNCGGALRFSEDGDSGAALVRADRRLVGLHHASVAGDPTRGVSCHIAPVLAQLGVTPITEANPVPDHPAVSETMAEFPVLIDGKLNQTPFLRDRFLDSDEGRRLAALVEAHRLEVIHLVNHRRPVTVTWHRGKGPAFLNRAIANAADPDVRIPRAIDGVTRLELLLRMERALSEHGSPELRAAIEEHRDEVVPYVDAFDSLHDLVDSLAERQAV